MKGNVIGSNSHHCIHNSIEPTYLPILITSQVLKFMAIKERGTKNNIINRLGLELQYGLANSQ